ncbi:MAG: NAD(P)H-hydrate dehydratase [Syntrophales bacterium]
MKVSSVDEMRMLDREAMEQFGLTEDILMENAGQASCFAIREEFGIAGRKFVIFCGTGNNGGDGFVVARKILSTGGLVKVCLLGDPGQYKGAARKNFEIISRMPVEVQRITSTADIAGDVAHSDAVVDAIFGTGLARPVEGLYRSAIELINNCGKRVFSLDIPSGVHGDTGEILGAAVKADCTITYGLPKRGNILYPGYEQCGKLYISHISFPPEHYDRDSIKAAVNRTACLPPRSRAGHKGYFGEVLFIAGAANYLGAPFFSAYAFLKAGGGYSRLAAPSSISSFIAMRGSELVMVPQKETAAGSISMENRESLLALADKMDMVVVGPGMSLHEETQKLIKILVAEISRPLLIDGDGITAISSDPGILKARKAQTVMTPHLGEMSRIVKMNIPDLNRNKMDILQSTAASLNTIIVLKGAHSLIGYPDKRVFINMTGNPGMAKAGSGDVLNGVIAAMFGMGLPFAEAVRKGVFIHGLAGDLAAKEKGEDGISAQDILDYLSEAVRSDREGIPEYLMTMYEGGTVI